MENTLNIHVKSILDDIIDVAYGDETMEERKRYKDFKLHILSKELNSTSGMYNCKNKTVQVYNISKHGKHSAIKTCLHEVAHHLDYCKNNCLGHQSGFYEEYKNLIYAALSMRILTVEEINSDSEHNDSNKVKKIVDQWVPSYVEYWPDKEDVYVFYARENYYTKGYLEKNGYIKDPVLMLWKKEVKGADKDEEIKYLVSLHIPYEIQISCMEIYDGHLMAFPANRNQEEILIQQGFARHKDNYQEYWMKKILLKESDKEMESIIKMEGMTDIRFLVKKI